MLATSRFYQQVATLHVYVYIQIYIYAYMQIQSSCLVVSRTWAKVPLQMDVETRY